MPKPIKRREFLRRLPVLEWLGPEAGGKHPIMRKTGRKPIHIPNPHGSDLDWTIVKRILVQAGIDPAEWEKLGE